ncbi:hypothetical protein D3C80_1820280 [compost metagenome]
MLRLHQGDTLATGGRSHQQQVFIETRASAATAVGLDTMGLQPQRPVRPIGILEQRIPQAILRLIQPRPAGQQAGAGDR